MHIRWFRGIFLALSITATVGCSSLDRERSASPSGVTGSVRTVSLVRSSGEPFEVSVYAPRSKPLASILFSHGGGSWPEQYRTMIDALTGQGFVVVAPTHADSLKRPKPIAFNTQEAFQARILEMQAAGRYADKTYGVPMAAVGHSYGSLFAAMAGGALQGVAPGRVDGLDAVLAFSTPGIIPGIVQPGAYRTLDLPYMVVTGGNDRIPGLVVDPADHLAAYKEAAGSRHFAVIAETGDHELIGSTSAEAVAARNLGIAFLKSELLRHRASTSILAGTPPAGLRILGPRK
jgi:alpha-beta hydrolase superfamily lysophospholipase